MNTSNAYVQPYIFFGCRCEEAIEFYRKTLGAEVVMLSRFKDAPEQKPEFPECFAEKIMHATLRIGETLIMASDGRCEGPPTFEGFSLSITVADETEAERDFSALNDGGCVTSVL